MEEASTFNKLFQIDMKGIKNDLDDFSTNLFNSIQKVSDFLPSIESDCFNNIDFKDYKNVFKNNQIKYLEEI